MKTIGTFLCAALAAAGLAACSGKTPSTGPIKATPRPPLKTATGSVVGGNAPGSTSAKKETTRAGISGRRMAGGGIVEDYWPTEGWRTSTPEDQEMDGTRLQAALESAQRQRLSLHGVVVIRHGYIVLEKYFASNNATSVHSLYSCTKSFVSALVGIAIDKRLIADVNQPVVSFFPDSDFEDPDKSKQEITIENLLTMSSGLNWLEADETYERMYTTYRDWVEFVLDLPMVFRPGLIFNYSSGCSHLLSAIIQKTSDKGTYDFARSNLFKPLGIKDPTWERDPSGIPIGGWGLSLSPRDMAKLGYLYLHGGKWERNQIVPASWVRSSTQPHIKADGDWQYGYQWWVDPSYSFYAAIGRYGQSIFVVPGLDLVVVFTAHIDSNDPETDLLKKYIIPACSSLPRNPPAGGKILQEEHGP